jgi:GT2 family glycosyltransferase
VSSLVSVLLPYRDAAPTVEEAIDSILAQRDVALEILAIDDGSTDGGASLVARMARGDRRVRPLTSERRGIVAALLAGLAEARGPVIARMDADDVSLPWRLRRQLDALAENPTVGALGTQVECFPEGAVGEGMLRYVAWQNALVTAEDHARDRFVESPLCHPSVVLRREALERCGPWREGPFPEDYELWLRLFAHGYQLAKVPEVLLRWRHTKGRATFRDPRFAIERFTETKAVHLAARLAAAARPFAVWGAGQTGKRLARALRVHGARPSVFIDIDPEKIGRTAQGAPIVSAEAATLAAHLVVVAVGARGARDLVRARLLAAGRREGDDFICAA